MNASTTSIALFRETANDIDSKFAKVTMVVIAAKATLTVQQLLVDEATRLRDYLAEVTSTLQKEVISNDDIIQAAKKLNDIDMDLSSLHRAALNPSSIKMI